MDFRDRVPNENDSLSKEDLEQKIKEYNDKVKTTEEALYKFRSSLVFGNLDNWDGVKDNEKIQGLDVEVNNLWELASELIKEIDKFNEYYKEESLSTNYKEVRGKITQIRRLLGNVKRTQVRQYNVKVDAINAVIEELRSLNDFNTNELLDQIPKLNKIDKKISWNTSVSTYISLDDYSKLIEANRIILEIKNNLKKEDNISTDTTTNENNNDLIDKELESDIKNIENEVKRIENEVYVVISDDDKNRLRNEINLESDNLNTYFAKLENNKDRLTQEKYNELIDRYNNSCEYLMDLNTKINDTKVFSGTEKVYNELMHRAIYIEGALNNLNISVNTSYGNADMEVRDENLNFLHNHYEADLDSLEKLVEEKYNVEPEKREIDNNHYNNLKNKIFDLRKLINKIDEILREPGVVKGGSINSFLNKELESLNKDITDLSKEINDVDGKIKHRDRKKYNLKIKQLEIRLNNAGNYVRDENDNDLLNKYNETKKNFDSLNKDYRRKCPLVVRMAKSAKNFYKKHKKIILIGVGLAAFALTTFHVIIPAIMHGNIMIAGTTPALRPIIKPINVALGSIIGATKDSAGMWFLRNGVRINPSCAASSLLKGIAVSSGAGTLGIVSLIKGVRKITEKMNMKELKDKLKTGAENISEKTSEFTSNAIGMLKEEKEKITSEYNRRKVMSEVRKNANKDVNMLLDKYFKLSPDMSMSLEEFGEIEKLNEDELVILKRYLGEYKGRKSVK